MSYQIIITEESAANIIIDNNTTNVSVTSNEYPIVIEYNAVIEQAGANTTYGDANVRTFLASGTNTGNIITSANVSGAYILGNGSQLTGLPATYTDANVVTLLSSFGSNTISTTGNITGGNFVGNGSRLTTITGANVSGTVANATYALTANSATYASFALTAGTANAVAGANVSGTVANATYALSANAATYATQAVTAGTANSVAGANVTGTVGLAQFVTQAAQANITSVGTLTSLAVTNAANVGSLLVNDSAVITGNLTVNGTTTTINSNTVTTNDKAITLGNNQSTGAALDGAGIDVGSNSLATWRYNNAGNAWVSNINITATGNVAGTYILGNGSQLTGIAASYGNAEVAAFLPTYTGNLPSLTGPVTTSGNVTGAYIFGNGSQLTGIAASYGNANVAANLAAFANNPISTTGNVSVGNFTVAGSRLIDAGNNKITNVATPVGNSDAATKGYVDSVASSSSFTIADDTATTTAVASGDTLTLNGTANEVTVAVTGTDQVTFGLPDSVTVTANLSAGNVNATNYVAFGTGGNVTTASPGQMFWDVTEQTVSLGMNNGVTQQIGLEQYVLVKASATITNGQVVMFTGAAGDNVQAAPANTASAGFRAEYIIGVATQSIALNGTGYITTFGTVNDLNTNAFNVGDILWVDNATPGALTATRPSDPNFQIEVAAVTKKSGGDGHIQVRVTAFNQLNELTDVTVTTPASGQALVYSGNVWINGNPEQANVANTANSVAGANVSGTVGLAQFVTQGAQANITSVGTLTSLDVTGNISANYYTGNGSQLTGITASAVPAGANTEIQFNNAGVFGSNANLTYNPSTRIVQVLGNIDMPFGNITSLSRLSFGFGGSITNLSTLTASGNLQGGNLTSTGVINQNSTTGTNNLNGSTTILGQSRLGSVVTSAEQQFATATTGSFSINRTQGQVQFIAPTGNITIGQFNNFLVTTTASPTQTTSVTLIVKQGATPYTVTMPTGNASIKYAGNITTVGATANAVSMINVTCANVANAALYMVTISPEFI